ncbi:hypothetical protein RHMOL_Rhmol09G0006100 [Rhododendron molle]|uniref:Uncharacterized protein n=1 Tax=Rhododendron molle TaxID=49168 RepID=A0ACC0MA52_RHOML|nr:hypothetical protein RHMOL_Rhmol09G0006100 [Rhododendron molle]
MRPYDSLSLGRFGDLNSLGSPLPPLAGGSSSPGFDLPLPFPSTSLSYPLLLQIVSLILSSDFDEFPPSAWEGRDPLPVSTSGRDRFGLTARLVFPVVCAAVVIEVVRVLGAGLGGLVLGWTELGSGRGLISSLILKDSKDFAGIPKIPKECFLAQLSTRFVSLDGDSKDDGSGRGGGPK